MEHVTPHWHEHLISHQNGLDTLILHLKQYMITRSDWRRSPKYELVRPRHTYRIQSWNMYVTPHRHEHLISHQNGLDIQIGGWLPTVWKSRVYTYWIVTLYIFTWDRWTQWTTQLNLHLAIRQCVLLICLHLPPTPETMYGHYFQLFMCHSKTYPALITPVDVL